MGGGSCWGNTLDLNLSRAIHCEREYCPSTVRPLPRPSSSFSPYRVTAAPNSWKKPPLSLSKPFTFFTGSAVSRCSPTTEIYRMTNAHGCFDLMILEEAATANGNIDPLNTMLCIGKSGNTWKHQRAGGADNHRRRSLCYYIRSFNKKFHQREKERGVITI